MAIKVYQTVATSILATLPGALPTVEITNDVDTEAVAASCLKYFDALQTKHFTDDAIWRDAFALTGTLRTLYSAATVGAAWQELAGFHHPSDFKLTEGSSQVVRSGDSAWVEAQFTFETHGQPPTTCSGFISLVPVPGCGWKIWVLRTIIEQLTGHQNVDKLHPQAEFTDSSTYNGDGAQESTHFDCVIVGGGQSGLSTAGRLKALGGVSYVVLEKNAHIGDNWKKRYDSARLHTTRHYAHLPFERTFSSNYQDYLTKDDLARGYQTWAKRYSINVWLSTSLVSGSWDSKYQRWGLNIRRDGQDLPITTNHIVFAVGAGSQIPTMPQFANREEFQGTILHSAEYKSASQWKGKRGIVVGTANTAHDVAEDMLRSGLSSVTMIQRGRTFVLPVEYFKKVSERLYNENVDIELADRIQFSNPASIGRLTAGKLFHDMARAEPERFDSLERAGFKVERFGDIHHHLNERQGGHYVDVGTSKMISKGLIKVKSDAAATHYSPDGLQFSDGVLLKADVIIFATGFAANLRQVVANTLGEDIADQVEDFWGLNTEGEINGAFKPTGHPKLWYIGGGCGHSRYYSRFVALQVKADVLGAPLKIYNDTPRPQVK